MNQSVSLLTSVARKAQPYVLTLTGMEPIGDPPSWKVSRRSGGFKSNKLRGNALNLRCETKGRCVGRRSFDYVTLRR